MSIKNKVHVHWFRNDLRLSDQPFVNLLSNDTGFVGIYILPKNWISYLKYGFRRMGYNRFIHLKHQLWSLQNSLREKGSELIVKVGEPTEILIEFMKEHGSSLSFEMGLAHEERQVENSILDEFQTDYPISVFSKSNLISPLDLNFDKSSFPKSFSKFRNILEKKLKNYEWKVCPLPQSLPNAPVTGKSIKKPNIQHDSNSAVPFLTNENEALKRVDDYFFKDKNVLNYKSTRNELLGKNYSTKFSIFLANGQISPHQIMHELKKFESNESQNKSTYWVWFELLWREYFRHASYHFGKTFFINNSLNETIKHNQSSIDSWKFGNTNNDFIDANMIELSKTGFMSNRGRQNAASFFIHNLRQDWKIGAAWLENQLIDYDVHSNYGNWQYIAGNNFNPKGKSVFDVEFQTKKYDPEQNYIQTWLNKK